MCKEEYNEGYITLHRKMTEWGWFRNANTFTLFVHLLLFANWKDGVFEGEKVEKGSCITSLQSLSSLCGLSVREVRTALEHLEKTGEIIRKSTNKWQKITVVNWEKYQVDDKKATSNRQTTDKQPTTNEERKKEISNIYPLPEWTSDKMKVLLTDWLTYKKQKKEEYVPKGWEQFCSQLKNKVSDVGEDSVIDCIRQSMANGWQGPHLEKAEKRQVRQNTTYKELP